MFINNYNYGEINPVKIQHETVYSMSSSSNECVWLYIDTDNEQINLYKEMIMNKFEVITLIKIYQIL